MISDISSFRKRSIAPIGFLATFIMVGIMLIPDLNTIGTETMLGVSGLWLITGLLYQTKIPPRMSAVLRLIVVYFIIVVAYKILGISTAWWDIAAGYYGCMACAIISTYSIYLFSDKQLTILKWTVYTVSIIAMVYVSITGTHNLTHMTIEEAISQESAVYGSSVIIFAGISLIGLLYSKSLIVRAFYLSGIILAFYVTVSIMQRGTNTVMLGLLILSILFFKNVKKAKPFKIIFGVAVIIFCIYYSGLFSVLIEYLIDIIPSERLAVRLAAIDYVLETGDALGAGSSLTSRTELMQLSLNSFSSSLSSIMFGIGDHRGFSAPVGNHSEMIDSLARYGIICFSILCAFFLKLLKWWYNIFPQGSSLSYQVSCVVLIFIARNIWGNALTSAISILLFLYLPLVIFPYIKLERNKL